MRRTEQCYEVKIMAGRFDTYIIEWKCLKPEVYNEEHGFIEWNGNSPNQVKGNFLERNPDYEVIDISVKEN